MKMTTEMMSLAAAAVLRNTSRRGLVVAGLLLAAGGARALTVVEDFGFYDPGSLTNYAAGSGFLNGWKNAAGVNAVNVTNDSNLSYSGAGYAVTQLGAGAILASASTGGGSTLSRRSLAAPIPGSSAGRTVWFSTLVRPTSSARLGWHFNANSFDRAGASAGFTVVESDFRKLDDGVLVSAGLPALTVNTTHLVLGSVVLKDTGVSQVSYWIDPADLTSTNTLGAAAVTFAATFGGSITNIGVEAYQDANGRMDALRISDGNGDSEKAFLAVTRATPKALFGPVQFGSLAELTNRFALVLALTNDWQSANDGNYGEGGFLRSTSASSPHAAHHAFFVDTDGAPGGGNDIFGDCTIDYDMRANGTTWERNVGAFFLGTNSVTRNSKHWMLDNSLTYPNNRLRAFYSRNIALGSGGTGVDVATNQFDCAVWRHVRLDVRRVNGFTQVQVRYRIWNSVYDFRGPPVVDVTYTYPANVSQLVDGEVGVTAYYYTTSGPVLSSADIDNVAVYRYGGAPDWYVPRGTLIRVQ
jgi:hypothetical protein